MIDPKLPDLAILPPERRVEVFYRTIEGTFKPRLARLHIDVERAWKERYRQDESGLL